MLSEPDQYVIKLAEGKAYGGGAVYKAIHRRCRKIMYLPAAMVRTVQRVSVK
jgi:hypothetical protein